MSLFLNLAGGIAQGYGQGLVETTKISWADKMEKERAALADEQAKMRARWEVTELGQEKQALELETHEKKREIDAKHQKAESPYAISGNIKLNKQTGETEVIEGARGKGTGKPTANIQEVEYLVSNKMAKNKTEAWEMVKSPTGGYTSEAMRLAKMEIEAQKDNDIDIYSPEYKTPRQLFEDAKKYLSEQEKAQTAATPQPMAQPTTQPSVQPVQPQVNQPPQSAIQMLKQNPTPEMKRFFEMKYKVSADQFL